MIGTAAIVRGDLLSCYTASVASYLDAIGRDADVPFCCQWFIGVKASDDPRSTEIRIYHTSLLGEGPDGIELRHGRAFDAAAAHAGIAAEAARRGAVIVLADTELLPWLVTHGRRSAPHWIVADAVDEHGRLRVVDRFEWNDVTGSQAGHVGWVAAEQMDWLRYQLGLERDRRFRSRERLVFGEPLEVPDPPGGDAPTWRWLERVDRDPGRQAQPLEASPALARRLLARSCGLLPVKLQDGERIGGAAILSLADVLERTLESGEAYALNNDLWVIGRTRRLSVERLAESSGQWGMGTWEGSMAGGLGSEIVTRWEAVARLMHYNQTVVQLGRAPRHGVIRLLHDLAALEDEFVGELRKLMNGRIHA